MKIRTLTLGEYGSPPTPFCLYLFPTPLTPPLTSPPFSTDKDAHFHFLCLEDLDALFFNTDNNTNEYNQLLTTLFEQHPAWFCKDQSTSRSYLMTQAVAHIATKLNIDPLVHLCRLTEDELFNGKATELLHHLDKLNPSSICTGALVEQEFVPTRLLDSREGRFHRSNTTSTTTTPMMATIKEEPQSPVIRLSPPSANESMPYDPCRDDVVDNRNRLSSMPRSSPPVVSSSSTSSLPLSHTTTPPHDDENDNINTNATTVDPHLQLPKPSSLLLKRSAGQQHHKAPTNLTIFTPSYANGSDAIRSAPLHPRASKQNGGLLQQRHPSNTQQRINKPTTATTAMNQKRQRQQHHQPPATAAPWQRQRGAPQTEFPSPPIVPSQQRYPPHYLRTATFPKTPMTNPPVQQQQQQQQHRHPPAVPHTAYHHPQQYQAPSTAVMPPLPPTTTLSKKQQFLQPFEMLYDNIEQTRQLKTTLDDHIRRSSSLIQTLQSSSTMVEALVRRHVRDAMQQQLQGYSHRVEQLEKRMLNRHHHRASTTSNSSHHGEDDHLDDRNRMTPTSSSTSPSPTPSSNMGHVLSELLERLDRLETKMDTRL